MEKRRWEIFLASIKSEIETCGWRSRTACRSEPATKSLDQIEIDLVNQRETTRHQRWSRLRFDSKISADREKLKLLSVRKQL
jgi:hypothetical protein